MIFGHLFPPVADAGSHGHRWREIATKIADVTNNKVNSNNKLKKNRITFKLHKINIDCTEITNLNTNKVQYQVELEVINKNITFNELIKILLKLLSIIN